MHIHAGRAESSSDNIWKIENFDSRTQVAPVRKENERIEEMLRSILFWLDEREKKQAKFNEKVLNRLAKFEAGNKKVGNNSDVESCNCS